MKFWRLFYYKPKVLFYFHIGNIYEKSCDVLMYIFYKIS